MKSIEISVQCRQCQVGVRGSCRTHTWAAEARIGTMTLTLTTLTGPLFSSFAEPPALSSPYASSWLWAWLSHKAWLSHNHNNNHKRCRPGYSPPTPPHHPGGHRNCVTTSPWPRAPWPGGSVLGKQLRFWTRSTPACVAGDFPCPAAGRWYSSAGATLPWRRYPSSPVSPRGWCSCTVAPGSTPAGSCANGRRPTCRLSGTLRAR